MRKNTIDDFWNKVDVRGDDECWLWTGTKNRQGYGWFKLAGKLFVSHRLAISTKCCVPDDKFVLHKCDNPSCCNPNHLFVGTHYDNMRDKVLKGRQHRPRGELQGLSKLTECQVKFIKNSTITHNKLAGIFGVSRSTISMIKSGRTWGHVP